MKKAGRKMHLQVRSLSTLALQPPRLRDSLSTPTKGHYVGLPGAASKKLFAPVDIEGHLGTDGRYYVVVRTFLIGNQLAPAPESPWL